MSQPASAMRLRFDFACFELSVLLSPLVQSLGSEKPKCIPLRTREK
jgi:hypothetical protein